jgi:putative ABC transport system ATP-binding protein
MTAFFECGPFSARDGEGRQLFEDVSLSLSDAQCVAIEGPSGGGKSTLLRHLTGLAWAPDAGRRLDGVDYPCGQLPVWRSQITLVAQDAPMIAGSIRDNLSFPFAQRVGKNREFEEGEADRLLESVGLERLPLDREIRTLSGGERHRVALVRGLLWDPPVLVTDETLSGLDPDAVAASFDLLLACARRPGRLVICVFHDPELNARADRHFRLADGRLEEVR